MKLFSGIPSYPGRGSGFYDVRPFCLLLRFGRFQFFPDGRRHPLRRLIGGVPAQVGRVAGVFARLAAALRVAAHEAKYGLGARYFVARNVRSLLDVRLNRAGRVEAAAVHLQIVARRKIFPVVVSVAAATQAAQAARVVGERGHGVARVAVEGAGVLAQLQHEGFGASADVRGGAESVELPAEAVGAVCFLTLQGQ